LGRWLTGIVVLMWALVLVGGAFRPGSAAAGVGPSVGQEAPPLVLPALDGTAVSLDDLQGKAVMLNFWASWCGPCRIEMPELQRLSADLPDGTALLTVNTESSPDIAQRFLTEAGYDLPTVQDASGRAAIDYQVLSLPTTLFISPEGRVTARVSGPLTYSAMLSYLKAAGR
jgi:thiol-disulfide isomerase/thioredoxin